MGERQRGRVLHVTTAHCADDARVFHRNVKPLHEAGYDVALAAPMEASNPSPILHIAIGIPGQNRWMRLRRILSAVRLMCSRSTALSHIHDPELLVAALAASIAGKRVVYDVHEFYRLRLRQSEWLPRRLRVTAARLYDVLERITLPKLAGVVVCTPEMYQQYSAMVARERLALVQNYTSFSSKEIRAARNEPSPLNKRYFIHTGGASGTKAFHIQVAVAELINASGTDITFVNAGSVDLRAYAKAEREDLLSRARRAGLVMLGRIERETLARWLAHAEIGYAIWSDTSNERKGLPTKIYEYFAFGLPVVAADVGANGEVVRNCDAGIVVDPNAAAEHAAAILRLAGDAHLRKAYSARALEAATKYSFESEFAALTTLYRNIGITPSGAPELVAC